MIKNNIYLIIWLGSRLLSLRSSTISTKKRGNFFWVPNIFLKVKNYLQLRMWLIYKYNRRKKFLQKLKQNIKSVLTSLTIESMILRLRILLVRNLLVSLLWSCWQHPRSCWRSCNSVQSSWLLGLQNQKNIFY